MRYDGNDQRTHLRATGLMGGLGLPETALAVRIRCGISIADVQGPWPASLSTLRRGWLWIKAKVSSMVMDIDMLEISSDKGRSRKLGRP